MQLKVETLKENLSDPIDVLVWEGILTHSYPLYSQKIIYLQQLLPYSVASCVLHNVMIEATGSSKVKRTIPEAHTCTESLIMTQSKIG